MRVDGQCHCGAIIFEAEVDPERTRLCHCKDCQRLSGSAFRIAVPTTESKFRLLTGTPSIYVKTAESGNGREQAFCPICGTEISATSIRQHAGEDRKMGVRVGTLRQADQLVPKRQFWGRSALGWLRNLSDIPCVDTQ
ncbi:MAG: GFA family protein [Cohaesibacteraceae bacterium]